ncbi:MAG: MmcQ/YjbR family DNA-binding protein [Proteobacteria bacterium]|nr:MmcQ/YjbR family DNA-binding protein [Pseudomonadota bacterium]
MATWEDVRAAAQGLPEVNEYDHMGERAFRVGKKGFVQMWEDRVVMKLERGHQELLFEARPEIFSPMVAGALRWSWVKLAALDAEEVPGLVREAWAQVAPKKVSRAYAERTP